MKLILVFLVVFSCQILTAQQAPWVQKADSIIANAKSQLGVPYKWGTSSPNNSFDCSGFASYIYGTSKVECSRNSKAYAGLGTKIELEDCRKGDCLVFSGTAPGSTTPGHVGIVVSNDNDGIKFIHCSSSKKHFGVVITEYFDSAYPKRFLQARRLF